MVVVVLCCVAAAVAYFLFRPDRASVEKAALSFDKRSFVNARRLVDYEQPSPALAEQISVVYSAEDAAAGGKPAALNGVDVVLADRVPFFQYWQNETGGRYIFHPLAYGRVLLRLVKEPDIDAYWDAAVHWSLALPNGGLLWYYPDRYDLNRFLGPDLAPSAIAQGVLLEAIRTTDEITPIDYSALARSVFKGLDFDYYQGGLNLADIALLEIPLFRSPPEVILNGWLAALLHLQDYSEFYDDKEATALFESNLEFLARSLPQFHDKRSGLSLYSDLSPYRVRVTAKDDPSLSLVAFYRARIPELEDLVFPLVDIPGTALSLYDNQLFQRSGSVSDVFVSCSQLYETYLVSDDGPFIAELVTGQYDPYRSTPDLGGEHLTLASVPMGAYHVVHVTSDREKLFPGYPTNFSKLNENYYHTYHVVALACLLASDAVPKDLVPTLRQWMERWYAAAAQITVEKGLTFTSYQKILDGIIRNGTHPASTQWEALLRQARGNAP